MSKPQLLLPEHCSVRWYRIRVTKDASNKYRYYIDAVEMDEKTYLKFLEGIY